MAKKSRFGFIIGIISFVAAASAALGLNQSDLFIRCLLI